MLFGFAVLSEKSVLSVVTNFGCGYAAPRSPWLCFEVNCSRLTGDRLLFGLPRCEPRCFCVGSRDEGPDEQGSTHEESRVVHRALTG